MRLCPQHGTHLYEERRTLPTGGTVDALHCPIDRRECLSWAVWDRRLSKLIGFGQPDRILMVEGECDDVLVTPWTEGRKRVHRARKWDR